MAEPMYRQIATDLQRRIESGALAQGAQLPTEIELREQYDASRNTVRDAIKWLIVRGLVETRPGQGTFVTEKINPFVTTLTGDAGGSPEGETGVYVAQVKASGRLATNSEVRVEIQQASDVLASVLRVAKGTELISRHQQRFIDGRPWSLQTSFYPMSLIESGATRLLQATNIPEGALTYLAEKCQRQQAGYRDTIAVRAPDDNEVRFFNLPADGRVPVFEIYRVSFDKKGDRFRLTITVYPSDRNRLRVDVGDVPARGTVDAKNTV
jgi:GntR family transcriptional regulator